MPDEMNIDTALAKLEGGKFSFSMVDAIKSHTKRLERELEVMRNLHASALRDLRAQKYANWQLEIENKKLNSRIRYVLRANRFVESAQRRMSRVAAAAGQYFGALFEKTLEQASDGLKSGRYQAQLIHAASELYEILKANLPTDEEARRKMQGLAIKTGEIIRVLKRQTGAGVASAVAFCQRLFP
jgi:hypothetical protein